MYYPFGKEPAFHSSDRHFDPPYVLSDNQAYEPKSPKGLFFVGFRAVFVEKEWIKSVGVVLF